SWLNNGGKQDEEAVSREEGSGSGSSYPYAVGHYPPDDEDAYSNSDTYAGSGSYEGYETVVAGSGDYGSGGGWSDPEVFEDHVHKTRVPSHVSPPSPYDPYIPKGIPKTPPKTNVPDRSPEQPPSAAAKETMSLYRAITIYMLPTFIMFLGSLA
ncbi:hypothetical protein SK128_014391, partial [Halocaridina rubra]